MRTLSEIVQEWRDRLMPPPSGRHAAARVRPYVTHRPVEEPPPESEPLAEAGGLDPSPVRPYVLVWEARRAQADAGERVLAGV
ncbi:hypothetical protein [Streptomonospora salina]|uniref:Uncharacterized protein n=1 Tax=Streptomonospora salina TaxID=104205 RepID=A0A841EC33_9ACTN|nr:hypothetical protein [Streptomonospora salina]MBB5998568.1 hypothetical protein [Streptomonospora salina]